MDKKAKAEAKRARRTKRKLDGDTDDSPENNTDFDSEPTDAEQDAAHPEA